MIICEVLARPKDNPNVHILTEGIQVMELADENHNYIHINSAHQAVCTVIPKGIM